MTKKKPTNVAASVRARLLQLAKQGREDFHYVLTRYGLERLLVRLVRSPHRAAFVLKGAMLFRAWSPSRRASRRPRLASLYSGYEETPPPGILLMPDDDRPARAGGLGGRGAAARRRVNSRPHF